MYKVTRQNLGWKTTTTPQSFQVDGNRISSPKHLANIQMKTFNDKIKKLVEKLPISGDDPLKFVKLALQRWGRNAELRPEFHLKEITVSQTRELLKQLGTSKSSGHDQLDSFLIKIASESLIYPIQFIINQSMKSCTFPNKWKIAQ